MAYAQRNYLELQGINGKYRISQIGCFLTSFCNLLERYGRPVDPVTLNRIFKERGIYVDVNDGIRDDLAYTSITRFDPKTVVIHSGKGRPASNNSIVKFNYRSNGGKTTTHFSLVVDASKGLILDSFDGKVKNWSVYGGPVFHAIYEDRAPKATPAPQATPAPVAANSSNMIVVQPGWGLSHVAKAAGYTDYASPSRWDYLAQLNGHANRSTYGLNPGQRVIVRGEAAPVKAPAPNPAPAPSNPDVIEITVKPGWGLTHVLKAAGYTKEQYERVSEWDRMSRLNGSDGHIKLKVGQKVKVNKTPLPIEVAQVPAPQSIPVAPAPVEVPAPTAQEIANTPQEIAPVVNPPAEAAKVTQASEDVSVIPVSVIKSDPDAWRKTLEPENMVYIADTSAVIKDLNGLHMDLQLVKGQKVTSGGRVTKDGVEYVISKKHVEEGKFYGISTEYLGIGQDADSYVGPLTSDNNNPLDDLWKIDLSMEVKESLKGLSPREKIVTILGKTLVAVSKLKFWKK